MSLNQMSRREFFKVSGALGGGLAAAGMLGACGSSSSSSTDSSSESDDSYTLVTDGKLTCVCNAAFPPFESMDENTGEMQGFDIDLAAALAQKMGLESEWLPSQSFDSIVPLIKQGGKADCTITGMTITDKRKQEIDFTDPYIDSNQAIVVLKTATAKTEDDLNVAGTQICAQSGTTGGDWAQENLSNATYVPLDDVVQCLTGVSTGLYAAAVCDLPVASNLVSKSYTDLEICEQIPTGEQFGIGVSKDNPNLTKALNKALAEIKSDGTMDNLQTQWFGSVISSS